MANQKLEKVLVELNKKIKGLKEEEIEMSESKNEYPREIENRKRSKEWRSYSKKKRPGDALNQARAIFRTVNSLFTKSFKSKIRRASVNDVEIYYDSEFKITMRVCMDDQGIHYTCSNYRDGWNSLDTPKEMVEELEPKLIYFAHKEINKDSLYDKIQDQL